MHIIVGLGNPGSKYKNNRHNVGQMFVDYLKNQSAGWRTKIKTVKTDVFMNQSGSFVKKIVSDLELRISDLIIAHDDLDIPLGKFKIQKGVGPKLHNGLESIENTLGTKDFWRIRIGVDNRPAENRIDGETYVLQDFTKEEKESLSIIFLKIKAQLKHLL